MKENCPHGKPKEQFCCSCKYGSHSHYKEREKKTKDLTEIFNEPFGKQIKGGTYD